MARWMNPSPEALAEFDVLLDRLDEKSRKIARCLDPWSLYRYEGYPHRWSLIIMNDPCGLIEPWLAFGISGAFNAVMAERIQPMDIASFDLTKVTPAELPAPDEPVGSLKTPFVIKGYEETIENAKTIR